VNTHPRRVCLYRLPEAGQKILPTLLTPAGIPVAQTTFGRHTRSRKGVTAIWHRQQSTTSMLWDYPCPKDVVARCLDYKPETSTARDSSAFTRRRMTKRGTSLLLEQIHLDRDQLEDWTHGTGRAVASPPCEVLFLSVKSHHMVYWGLSPRGCPRTPSTHSNHRVAPRSHKKTPHTGQFPAILLRAATQSY